MYFLFDFLSSVLFSSFLFLIVYSLLLLHLLSHQISFSSVLTAKVKVVPWSNWVKTNTTRGGYFEQRFRFSCSAPVPDRHMIRAKHMKSQVRFCFNNGVCHNSGELRNPVDIYTPVDRVLRKYCKFKRKLFRKYCNCRTLGVFLVCQKCS